MEVQKSWILISSSLSGLHEHGCILKPFLFKSFSFWFESPQIPNQDPCLGSTRFWIKITELTWFDEIDFIAVEMFVIKSLHSGRKPKIWYLCQILIGIIFEKPLKMARRGFFAYSPAILSSLIIPQDLSCIPVLKQLWQMLSIQTKSTSVTVRTISSLFLHF